MHLLINPSQHSMLLSRKDLILENLYIFSNLLFRLRKDLKRHKDYRNNHKREIITKYWELKGEDFSPILWFKYLMVK